MDLDDPKFCNVCQSLVHTGVCFSPASQATRTTVAKNRAWDLVVSSMAYQDTKPATFKCLLDGNFM